MSALPPRLAVLAALLGLAAPAEAAPQTHDITVKGPLTVEISSVSVDIVVKKGAAKDRARVVADLTGGIMGKAEAEIEYRGRVLEIDGLDPTVRGTVTVEVPAGSSLEAESVQGSITASDLAAAEVESVSGRVRLVRVERVEVQSVSGAVEVTGGTRHQIETVSGEATIAPSGSAPDVEVESVSGTIRLRGACGKGCRVQIETLSASAVLELARTSSFAVRFETFSGRLVDKLGATPAGGGGKERAGRLGKGEGRIEVETFSGSVELLPPRT